MLIIIQHFRYKEMKRLSEKEFTQILIEAGYSERVSKIIEQWYNSH
jgi:hypothetical protein